jgi:hypothetical protein
MKGFKPSSFRSIPNVYKQTQPTQSESKMVESSGKRPRSSIKCWGCKGESLYRDCLHKEEKMRIVHNLQEATTVEDINKTTFRTR